MSLTILSNVAASQRIVDLLNYTNQKNISLAQVDFNSLTALAQAHHDAFGRNTTLNVVAVITCMGNLRKKKKRREARPSDDGLAYRIVFPKS